jgi:ComF family protein
MGLAQSPGMSLLHLVLSTLFPPRCAACRAELRDAADANRPGLCVVCRDTLVSALDACCPVCGAVWLDARPGEERHVCGPCQADPPPWVEARAIYAYGGALQEAITRWKNPSAPGLGESIGPALADLMVAGAAAAGWQGLARDVVVAPIPATHASLVARGFNPASVLARRLARRLGRRFDATALTVRRAPERSAGLGRRARQRRLRGVFEARPERVQGRSILLVDDVMTTGATVRAATSALLRAGARGVRVAVLARVPGRA